VTPVVRESSISRILVVRRDNIGDLVCTTPLISALRRRYPEAWIGALVNSYNAPVLHGNKDLNEVFAYRKLKHREPGDSLLGNLWARYGVIAELRRRSLDYLVLAGNAARSPTLARLVRPKAVVAAAGPLRGSDIGVAATEGRHEVEITFGLARAFDIGGLPPAPTVFPEDATVARLRAGIAARIQGASCTIGIHISARKPSQRWPIERFAELAGALARQQGVAMLLFWSPGAQVDPRHPGDDEKAKALTAELRGLPIVPVPTPDLGELIAGLSFCDRVVCSDGGAMHLAAALGKPIVCMFGRSDAARWHPWGVRYELLQPASLDVRDLSVSEVAEALGRLDDPEQA